MVVHGDRLTLTASRVRLYHAQSLRLETFSKKHANIFTGSNRAKSDDDNGIKRITITLVESV